MSEVGSGGGHTREGAQPKKTKRWRGYHRALKRGHAWAVRLSKMSLVQRLFSWTYDNEIFNSLVYCNNPLLKMIPKAEVFLSAHVTFPTDWAGKDGRRKRSYYRRVKK